MARAQALSNYLPVSNVALSLPLGLTLCRAFVNMAVPASLIFDAMARGPELVAIWDAERIKHEAGALAVAQLQHAVVGGVG